MSITRSGNRLTFSNYSVEMLILWAYDIRSERLLGKPKGLDSARYDIVAVAPPGAPVAGRLNRMMQSLLADRFRLIVHKESRELPFYALVVDKDGPKVHVEEPAGPGAYMESTLTPSIFTAVKEQLGLRLDAVKGPVEVIVIDRVEIETSEN